MTDTVPLNKLDISPRNVRKTNADEDIAGLAESIASKGLLQNLVVSPSADGKRFEVDAGGRRFRALQLLAARKDLPKNWPVPVKLIALVDARQASLAENLQKVSMNPADEVEAFDALIEDWSRDGMDQHTAIANCSKRFGVTERYVRQRLALASLAPEILDALRTGAITVHAAQAYASHPDRAEQLKVFKGHEKRTGTYGKHDPRSIKDELAGRIYPVDHKLVRYVGLDAYRKAGGEIAADLFFDEDEREILLNPALVDKLAAEKGALEAPKLAHAEGWFDAELQPVTGGSWVSPKAPAGYTERYVGSAEKLPAEQRAEAIAIYGIDDEAQLKLKSSTVFVKKVEDQERPAASSYKSETAEERAARLRKEEIYARAVKLAAPQAVGTPFEGKLFWPLDFSHLDYEEDRDDETTLIVNVQLRIPKADVDEQLAEAERRYEFDQQELREEAEALAAEAAQGAGPDDADGEHGDPNVNDSADNASAELPAEVEPA